MKDRLTFLFHHVTNFCGDIKLGSVLFVIALLYLVLFLLWQRLLRKSGRDHKFGESFISQHEPKLLKIKLI